MDELIESMQLSTIYDAEREFEYLLEELKMDYNEWTVAELSKTRQRYLRYLRSINFGEFINLEKKIEQFMEYTKIPQKADKKLSYDMKKNIDTELFLIITGEEKRTGGGKKTRKHKRKLKKWEYKKSKNNKRRKTKK